MYYENTCMGTERDYIVRGKVCEGEKRSVVCGKRSCLPKEAAPFNLPRTYSVHAGIPCPSDILPPKGAGKARNVSTSIICK
jgi:hypothetical protein